MERRDIRELEVENFRIKEEIEHYRIIFDNSLDAIFLALEDGSILSANPAACRMFGRSEAELCALGRRDIFDTSDPQVQEAFAERDRSGRISSEMTLVQKDGTIFPGEVTSQRFTDNHGRVFFSTIIRDISERKKAEAILRGSEEKFAKVFHNNQASLTLSRLRDGVLIDVNQKVIEATGYTRDELLGSSDGNFWFDIQDQRNAELQLAKKGYLENFETRLMRKSGEIRNIVMAANVLDIEGEPHIIVSTIDITEHKKAEEALRLSEEHFYKAFHNNPLAMSIINMEKGTFLEVNEVFTQRSGFNREELMGQDMDASFFWVDENEKERFLAGISQDGVVKNQEIKIYVKSGEMLTTLLSGVKIRWKNQACLMTVLNDITEVRHYQQEIARLDRLNLIGEMSAGIAHEIRNPMTTVKGFLQLFERQDRYSQDRENIDLMIEELDRANSIITEFLTLAKNKPIDLKRRNLNNTLRRILPLVQVDAMAENILIKLDLGNIPELMIDKSEIRQLVINLVRNAIDATGPGGAIIIRTVREGDSVILAVQDQGAGIAPEVQKKLGTPFVTTKDKGTGLGLAVCYNIAHRHNARIEVESSSSGTAVYIRFQA